jgi:hypothetical protein
VFQASEVVTGKRLHSDPGTLSLAVTMTSDLLARMRDELENRQGSNGKAGEQQAHKALGLLTSIARLNRDQQSAFSAGWTAAAS